MKICLHTIPKIGYRVLNQWIVQVIVQLIIQLWVTLKRSFLFRYGDSCVSVIESSLSADVSRAWCALFAGLLEGMMGLYILSLKKRNPHYPSPKVWLTLYYIKYVYKEIYIYWSLIRWATLSSSKKRMGGLDENLGIKLGYKHCLWESGRVLWSESGILWNLKFLLRERWLCSYCAPNLGTRLKDANSVGLSTGQSRYYPSGIFPPMPAYVYAVPAICRCRMYSNKHSSYLA